MTFKNLGANQKTQGSPVSSVAFDVVKDLNSKIQQVDATKQPLIKSSDEIKEGDKNLFFTADKAKKIAELIDVQISHAQPKPIESSDEITEGKKNVYFTPKRVEDIVRPSVEAALQKMVALFSDVKDLIDSGDAKVAADFQPQIEAIKRGIGDISSRPYIKKEDIAHLAPIELVTSHSLMLTKRIEDINVPRATNAIKEEQNLYFTPKRVTDIVDPVIAELKAQLIATQKQMDLQAAVIEQLQAKIASIAIPIVSGLSANSTLIVNMSADGLSFQEMKFENGLLKFLSPVSRPKKG